MRNSTKLFGVLLTAGTLAIGAVHTEAAQPQPLRSDCRTTSPQAGAPCTAARPVRAAQQTHRPARTGVTKAALDRNVCSRLQTQLERDTCLNRVEATA